MTTSAARPQLTLATSLRSPIAWCAALAGSVVVSIAVGADPAVIAVALTAFVLAFLADIDVRTHRLPNVVVLPLIATSFVVLALVALFTNEWSHLLAAVAGGLGLGACYLLLALLRAGGMGGGDVKLAVALGLTGGWFGLHAWIWVMFAPFVIGGLLALLGLVVRRLTWTAHMPFGPAMALGYVVAAVIAF